MYLLIHLLDTIIRFKKIYGPFVLSKSFDYPLVITMKTDK